MIVKRITNSEIEIDTPAKINLFLEVLNKRPDGFHNINSLFQAVSLFDSISFTLKDEPGAVLKVLNDKDIPVNEDNLIIKSFNLMADKFELKKGMKINLTKRIPIAAGLGGGSSDAAATILAINLLYSLGLEYKEMAHISAEIGSDLSFFFTKGQALITGRGEIIKEVDLPTDYTVVLVNPNFSISTPESYAGLKRGLTNFKTPFSLPCCYSSEDLVVSLGFPKNDFEEIHFQSFSELKKIKDVLLEKKALLARMSGSGPTMFGIYIRAPESKRLDFDGRGDWQIFIVEPITLNRHSF